MAALMALSVSCKKTSSTPAPPTTVKLKYLTQQTTADSTASGVFIVNTITYGYDSQKRLISQNVGSNLITYTYNDSGHLYSITNTRSNSTTYKKELSYTDDKLSSASYWTYSGNAVTQDSYGFVFNGNNMTELHANGDHGYNVTIYSYDSNNNLINSSINLDDVVTEYTYDDKKSRFTNMPQDFKNVFTSSFIATFNSSVEASSANNVISQKTNSGAVTNYTYTYDSDGYPTTRSTKTGAITIKDTFTYSEL